MAGGTQGKRYLLLVLLLSVAIHWRTHQSWNTSKNLDIKPHTWLKSNVLWWIIGSPEPELILLWLKWVRITQNAPFRKPNLIQSAQRSVMREINLPGLDSNMGPLYNSICQLWSSLGDLVNLFYTHRVQRAFRHGLESPCPGIGLWQPAEHHWPLLVPGSWRKIHFSREVCQSAVPSEYLAGSKGDIKDNWILFK